MSSVHVTRPGLLTTVQDLGRFGWQAYGVSTAGPMDPRAHRLANALVGNAADAATLEITLVGPELTFEDDRLIAVCGADFVVTVGDHLAASGCAFRVPRGSPVRFGARTHGSRAYLAVSGGIDVMPLFGSRATHLPSRLGGHAGRALRAGDTLRLGPPAPPPATRRPAVSLSMPRGGHATLHVLPSHHAERFGVDAIERLQSARYTVSQDSNRMGFRLEGPSIRTRVAGELLSEPVTVGAVQVPHDGHPILLMPDRQTSGGYPTLGTVISADLGLAGQLGPGDTITFAACDAPQALAALVAQERALLGVTATR